MAEETVKEYKKGELTIVWQPSLCIHSTNCWKAKIGLPSVFNPRVKPWINPEGASNDEIIAQVKKCPSGALSIKQENINMEADNKEIELEIEATARGPLLVKGNFTLKDQEGNTITKSGITAFCRCGHSNNKPFCDGSHRKNNFEG